MTVGAVDRTDFEFVVVVIAGPGRDGQDIGDDVEIQRPEDRLLVVTTPHVFAEAGRIAPYVAAAGRPREGLVVAEAGQAAGQGGRQGGGIIAGGDGLVVEVHEVMDPELLDIASGDRPDAPIVRRAEADFVAQVSVLDLIVPAGDRGVAGQRPAAEQAVTATRALVVLAV